MANINNSGRSKRRNDRIKQRLLVHILRINALIEPINDEPTTNGQNPVRIILNDFSISGMGFFSSNFLDYGQPIKIQIYKPTNLITHATVVWCQEFETSSKILFQKERFKYRIGVEFKPKNELETESIHRYFETLIDKDIFIKI